MTQVNVKIDFRFDGGNPAAIEAHLDDVMSALLDMSVCDPSLALDLVESRVEFEVVVDVEDLEAQAIPASLTILRTAIHAAGGATPSWDRVIREMQVWTADGIETCSDEMPISA